jgi:monoamine oxidase
MDTDVDVVIVGGGAAGIGAARRLAQSNLSTLLLEADSRLGGRAWTHEVAGMELDLGCGWLHSAERNSWAHIAAANNIPVDRSRAAWGTQYRDLGYTRAEQGEARRQFDEWTQRLATTPPSSDRASDALDPGAAWNSCIRAIVSFISGAVLERLSAADFVAYDDASTDSNWRSPGGYGALIARSFPAGVELRLGTPVDSLAFAAHGVTLTTPCHGSITARAVILTVSTAVLAGETIRLPPELAAWRESARHLPLGRNEKFFLEIVGDAPFEAETHVLGDPRDASSGAYYIRPFGRPVIEAFVGGEGARVLDEGGIAAGFAFAIDQLSALFGASVRRNLHPLVASSWSRSTRVGGAYSYALPGHAGERGMLARPCEQRVFFAGEATSAADFSTAHGAHDSGARAADEVLSVLRDESIGA